MKKLTLTLLAITAMSSLYSVDSTMIVTNSADWPVLVVPIPQNEPPYVLFTVPTSKPPAGYTGPYQATPAQVNIPDKISTLFFISAPLMPYLDQFIAQKKAFYESVRAQKGSSWRPDWKYAIEKEFLPQYPNLYWTQYDWGNVIAKSMTYKRVEVPLDISKLYSTGALNVVSKAIKYYM